MAVDWDTAIAPAHVGESDTSLYVAETLAEVVSELECQELITPAKREIDAEGRVAAPATRVARRVTAEEVCFIHSFIHSFIQSFNHLLIDYELIAKTRTLNIENFIIRTLYKNVIDILSYHIL